MISIDGVPQTTLDLLRTILINQMPMREDRVNIYDEKWKIPPDEEMFITLEYRNSKAISNRNTFVSGSTPSEVQDVNMLENITIGIFSRNRSAMQRKEEVLMAVMSSYAQSLQEAYAFKVSRIGSIEDLSALEATAMLKRYDVNLTVYAWYQKVVTPGYIAPPFSVKVIANDPGNGEMINQFTQFTTQPT